MIESNQNSAAQAQHPRVDVLLVTVREVEVRAVLHTFQAGPDHQIKRHFIGDKTYFDLGVIGGARIFMVQSEMGAGGPSGALLTVREGIQVLSPSAVVMVGMAFGVDPNKQHIGDILVSQQLLAYELQRVGSGPEGQREIILRGDRPQASTRLLDKFRSGALDWQGARVQFGPVLSGDKLVDYKDFREQLRKLAPEAIGGEMEGAGLYAVAQRFKVDWILVKAICDWADGKKRRNKSRRQELAATNAAKCVLHVIQLGGWGDLAGQSRSSSMKSEAPQPYLAVAQVDPVKLRKAMLSAYSKPSLELLCADLGISFDILQEGPLENKIMYLIEYFQHLGQYEKLVREVLAARPHLLAQLQ